MMVVTLPPLPQASEWPHYMEKFTKAKVDHIFWEARETSKKVLAIALVFLHVNLLSCDGYWVHILLPWLLSIEPIQVQLSGSPEVTAEYFSRGKVARGLLHPNGTLGVRCSMHKHQPGEGNTVFLVWKVVIWSPTTQRLWYSEKVGFSGHILGGMKITTAWKVVLCSPTTQRLWYSEQVVSSRHILRGTKISTAGDQFGAQVVCIVPKTGPLVQLTH